MTGRAPADRPGAALGRLEGASALLARAAPGLSLLTTPLLVLGSAHELYLRNQQELDHTLSVLSSFWVGAVVVIGVGSILLAFSRCGWARVALWAYHAAGFLFVLFSVLRALPWGDGLVAWVVDQTAVLPVAGACYVAGVGLLRRHDPRGVAAPLALLAAVLLLHEGHRFASRLAVGKPVSAETPLVLPRADPSLANVYHLTFDAFQSDLFDLAWEAERPLDGFVYFTRARTPYASTQAAMATTLSGARGAAGQQLGAVLSADTALPQRLRAAGYRTLAYLPPSVYPDPVAGFDRVVWHEWRAPADHAAALHRALFVRLWAFNALPAGMVTAFGTGPVGLSADGLRELRNHRLSALTQPLTSVAAFERFLHEEPSLPSSGRYTFIHLLLPHSPYVLASDCRQVGVGVDRRTDALAQSRCAAALLGRFLQRLERLGRLTGATVLVQGDHGSGLRWEGGALVADDDGSYRPLLLIRPPGAAGPLVRSETHASLVDVAPTLLAGLGLAVPESYEGRALLGGAARESAR